MPKTSIQLSDEKNPDFLLNTVYIDLIVQIANGTIDVRALAKKELAGRGLDATGKWVGFKRKTTH